MREDIIKGLLVSIEGIDGAGKSTFAKKLFQFFINKNLPALLTKEPGATKLGLTLRNLLQKKEFPICPKSEFLLFMADRAQHFDEIIIPNLKENKIVISDRMDDSTLAYQGYGRGTNLEIIKYFNNWVMSSVKPDIIFYLKIDIETAFERIHKRNEEISDFEKRDFIQKVLFGFEEIFKNRENVITLDATKSEDEILNDAVELFEKKIAISGSKYEQPYQY